MIGMAAAGRPAMRRLGRWTALRSAAAAMTTVMIGLGPGGKGEKSNGGG
jgi:hypothetical protein